MTFGPLVIATLGGCGALGGDGGFKVKGQISSLYVQSDARCWMELHQENGTLLDRYTNIEPTFEQDFVVAPYAADYYLIIGCDSTPATYRTAPIHYGSRLAERPADLGAIRLDTAEDAAAVRAIDDYVRQTRHWPKDSYRVERKSDNHEVSTFWVVHKAAEDAAAAAGIAGSDGKSFAVELDMRTLRVVRELGFQ